MKPTRILLFLTAVVAAIAACGEVIPNGGFSIAGMQLRFANLHTIVAQIEEDATVRDVEATTDDETAEALRSTTDSLSYYTLLTESGNLRFWMPNAHYLDAFWQAAESARTTGRTLRVLHYGDSQIEMDHITSRLRSKLQAQFGGSGPGMLPASVVTPIIPVRYSSHGDMRHVASFGDSLAIRSRGNYGPMMQCFRLDGGATITVRPSTSNRIDPRNKSFAHVRLISKNSGSLRATLSDIASKQSQKQAASERGVVALEWQADSIYASGIRLSLSGQADLYALLVDGIGGGLAVDNIPMRGCSGQQFTLVDRTLLQSAYDAMDVGLIILQFGGNSVPYLKTSRQISTYCQSLGKQIDHLHACCPHAKILFVGPSDMSTRIGGQLQTYPIMEQLIDSLSTMAVGHGAAYWSIYHAMGGKGSMVQWVKQGLAGSDYIHFSQRGADIMGDRLAEALQNSYRRFVLQREERAMRRNQLSAQQQRDHGSSTKPRHRKR